MSGQFLRYVGGWAFLVGVLIAWPFSSYAQHKGLSFQAVMKKPDGTYPTVSGLSVTLQVLDPISDCVLREEIHNGVNISNGYINLVLGGSGASTPAGKNPSPVLSIAQIMDNSVAKTGLNCVDMHNNISTTGQTYIPSETHARKLRLRTIIGTDTIVADFNMRAVAFAVNAENLGGKAADSFIQADSTTTTQARVDSVFGRYSVLDAILNGTYAGNAATATALANAPGACPAGQYISAMSASGTITCATPTGGSGTVTEVTSANSFLTVSTGTTTPLLTVNVGTAANTVAAGNDARFTDARTPTGTAGGDLSGTYPNPTVAKIAGKSVVLTTPANGEFLKYDGTNFVNAAISNTDSTKLPLAGGTMSGAIEMGTQNLTNVGYLTMSSGKNLHLSNNASDPSGLVAADKGKIWFNSTSGQVKYWDGASAQAIGAGSNALADGKILVGNSSNVAAPVTVSGDATLSNAGVLTLATVPVAKGGTGVTSFAGDKLVTTTATGALQTSSCALDQVISFDSSGKIVCANVSALAAQADTSYTGKGIVQFLTDAATSGITLASGVAKVNTGTGADQIVKLDASSRLPAVDGSQLTSLAAGQISSGTLPIARGGTGVASFGGNSIVATNGTGSGLISFNCTLGQVIKFDASGFAVCGTDNASSTTEFINGGNSFGTAAVLGTSDANTLTLKANNTTAISINTSGQVGVGAAATTPAAPFDVAGTIRSRVVDNLAGTTFNWLTGNLQYTTAPCAGATWTMNNVLDGGSYTLIVKASGAHTGMCNFTGAGVTTWHFQPANATPSGSSHVVYTFLRAGPDVYVSWIEGF